MMDYIDTPCFVKYYRYEADEEGADEIIKIVEDAKLGRASLIASFLLIGESVSVFDKWVRYKFISYHESEQTIKKFIRDVQELSNSGMLTLESVSTSTITNCLDLITHHHLSINDAIHLFAALSNKAQIDKFICCDNILTNAAKKEGFKVLNPEDENSKK